MTPSSSNTVRYGIIGCGMMGQEHLRNIAPRPGQTARHDDPVTEVRCF